MRTRHTKTILAQKKIIFTWEWAIFFFLLVNEYYSGRLEASRETNLSYINSYDINSEIRSKFKNMKSKVVLHRMFGYGIRHLINST